MEDWTGLGRVLILLGIVLVLAGALFTWFGKGHSPGGFGQLLGWFGKLPGDILIKRDQFTLYVPLATGVVISIVVSLLLYLWSKR